MWVRDRNYVWTLLPQTSCRQCGEQTCFIFATKLAAWQKRIGDRPPLLEPEYVAQLAQLRATVTDVPATGWWRTIANEV